MGPTERLLHLPLEQITGNPEIERETTQAEMDELKRSIEESGLIQPIGVTPLDKSSYMLTCGSRRLKAFQELGLPTIPAYIVERATHDHIILAGLEENLVRTDSGLDKVLLIKKRNELRERLFGPKPETRGRKPTNAPEQITTVPVVISSPAKKQQDYLYDRLAKHFTENELRVMKACEVSLDAADAILKASKDDTVLRGRIVTRIAAGDKPAEAIAGATDPESTVIEIGDMEEVLAPFRPKTSDAGSSELSDKEWLEEKCGDIRKRLIAANNHAIFDLCAVLYRQVRADLKKFKDEHIKRVCKAKEQGLGGFLPSMLLDLLTLKHPSEWWFCTYCNGTGKQGTYCCPKCFGEGFKKQNERA